MTDDFRDPGWRSIFGPVLAQLFMPWRISTRRTQHGGAADGLTQIRAIWSALVLSLFLFLFVMSFMHLRWTGSAGLWPYGIAAIGSGSIALVYLAGREPLRGDSFEALSRSYVSRFFRGFAEAEVPALLAFMTVFITGRLWLYVEGLAFSVVGMMIIAPTRRNLARYQTRLKESGSSLSLVEALMRGVLPGRPKRTR